MSQRKVRSKLLQYIQYYQIYLLMLWNQVLGDKFKLNIYISFVHWYLMNSVTRKTYMYVN